MGRKNREGSPRRRHGPGCHPPLAKKLEQSMKLPRDAQSHEATGPWSPYAPSNEAPWDLRRVVHLHRRTGFAATWSEIQRDLKDGPQASLDRLLTGKAATDGVPEEFYRTADLL